MTFHDSESQAAIPGTVTLTQTTDSSGNFELQASLTVTAQVDQLIYAQYSGDTNYPLSQSLSDTTLTVSGTDFAVLVNPGSLTISRGSQKTVMVYIEGQSSYSGSVPFTPSSCSGLPSESSCIWSNPTTINGVGYTILDITTTAPHASAKRASAPPFNLWNTLSTMAFGIVFLGGCARGRSGKALLAFAILGLLFFLPACGGGGNSSGGGGGPSDPGTPTGNYVVTITGTSGSVSHTANIMLTVN